jgi:hypothetical protein
MTGHDIICLHTMVGYLVSTDHYFSVTNGVGYIGTESHYGIGGKWGPDLGGNLDGAIWQWQDRGYTADANLDGKYRVISIETADNAPARPEDIQPWTPKQVASIAKLLAWECSPAAHAACPSTWTCHQSGIPLALIPDTKPGRRGIGYHRQGIDPWRVDGGVYWSKVTGKSCPTNARIAQIPGIITLAREGTNTMTPAEIQAALRVVLNEAVHESYWNGAKLSLATLIRSTQFYALTGGTLGNYPNTVYREDLAAKPTTAQTIWNSTLGKLFVSRGVDGVVNQIPAIQELADAKTYAMRAADSSASADEKLAAVEAELAVIKAAIAALPEADQEALVAKIAEVVNRVAVADVTLTFKEATQ